MIECFQKRDNDIADDREGDENIECTADTVALVADLDDVKYFFFHSGYFYNNFWGNVAYLKKWYIHLDQVLFISVEKTPTSSGGE